MGVYPKVSGLSR